jgi:hypothetical protein
MEATQAQVDYLVSLFVDCGFTLAERKAFLARRFGTDQVDDLTKNQASTAITELKEQKERNATRYGRDDD